MIFALFCVVQANSIGNFSLFTKEDSPRIITLQKDQGLMMVSYAFMVLKISIPDAFTSPKYATCRQESYTYQKPYYLFYFNNTATIEMHFTSNISFYTFNASNLKYKISNKCDFLYENFQFKCENDFRPREEIEINVPFIDNYYFHRSDFINLTNVAIYKYGGIGYEEIKNLYSQPPYSLKIITSPYLLSNASIEVDYGSGKQPLSTYNLTAKEYPFNAKFYITYRTCNSFNFKNYSIPQPVNYGFICNENYNYSLYLEMSDIPECCYSYYALISISRKLPWSARIRYQIDNSEISKAYKYGSEFTFSRNYAFNITFYVIYSKCDDLTVIKTTTVNDPFKPTKINISNSDIPKNCFKNDLFKKEI